MCFSIMVNQIYILLSFFITGFLIGILFDFFRISRKAIKTPDIITYIQDIIFWLITGAVILVNVFLVSNGELRLYMIIILSFGSFVYFFTISKYFICLSVKIVDIIKKILRIIIQPFKKIINFFKKFSKKDVN